MTRFLPAVAAAVLLTVLAGSASALPGRLNYQGRLTDANGLAVADGLHQVRFSIWDDQVVGEGTELWSETHDVITADGVFGVRLGDGGSEIPIGLFRDPTYLEIQVVGEAALTPRQALTTAPFAMVANSVEVGGVDGAAILDRSVDSGHLDTASVNGRTILDASLGPDHLSSRLIPLDCPPAAPTSSGDWLQVCELLIPPEVRVNTRALWVVNTTWEQGLSGCDGRVTTDVQVRHWSGSPPPDDDEVPLATGHVSTFAPGDVLVRESVSLTGLLTVDSSQTIDVRRKTTYSNCVDPTVNLVSANAWLIPLGNDLGDDR